MTSIRLRDVLTVLEGLYPQDSAQSWDRVGLVTGDPEQPVRRIHAAVDPTLEVIAQARDAGADLLITHHPLLLRGVHSVATTSAKGAAITSLVVGDVAMVVAAAAEHRGQALTAVSAAAASVLRSSKSAARSASRNASASETSAFSSAEIKRLAVSKPWLA